MPSGLPVTTNKLPPMPNAIRLRPLRLALPLLLGSFSASSQATKPLPARPVCLTIPEAEAVRDSLGHLPTVRREAREWQLAYLHARLAADTNAYAAWQNKLALLASQRAFAGQLLLLDGQRAKTQQFKARAHRKGWVIAALLAGIGLFGYLR